MSKESNESIVATKRSDKYRNYIFWGMALVTGFLLYYQFFVSENFYLEITGEQLIVAIALFGGIIWFYNRDKKEERLPPKDVLARKCADWYFKSRNGILDWTNCEVEQINPTRAMIYFPEVEKTFQYEAGSGFMTERWKDIEESLIDNERSITLKRFTESNLKESTLRSVLEKRGLIESNEE